MNRSAAVIGWGKSGQGAAGALLTRGWEVSAFAARPTQTLSFDDVAGVPVHVEEEANALAAAVLDGLYETLALAAGVDGAVDDRPLQRSAAVQGPVLVDEVDAGTAAGDVQPARAAGRCRHPISVPPRTPRRAPW